MATPPPRSDGALRRREPVSTAPRRRTISVRTATVADIDSVVALRLALLREEGVRAGNAPLRRDAASRARRSYGLQLADPAEATLLAIDRGTAVGVLRCTMSREVSPTREQRYAFLTSAYVVPSHRRHGVMRRLLTAADAWCRIRRLSEMRLHVQWENVSGNSAWDALGFEAFEVRRRRVVPEG